jgi:uncharacterized membrane protein YdjX (TVP38/TMEM64 family)
MASGTASLHRINFVSPVMEGPAGFQYMFEKKPLGRRKSMLLVLAGAGFFTLVTLALLLRAMSVQEIVAQGRELVDRVKEWSRTVGPIPFFAAMALLPAAGFPIMFFSLSAGVLFVPQIGLGWAITGALISLGINISLTYWLARYALRPLLEGVVRKLGYGLPQVAKENQMSLTLLCRITPGPPFFVQNYLLGLAKIPFWTYLWVSWLISATYSVAMVVFGDSLMHGSGKVIFFAVSIFIAISLVIKWVRRRYTQKKAEIE